MIDRQLLDRFVSRKDSAAFHDLVARHAPAVLRTCRNYLHDPHEAEDAAQATFLVLIRRAPSIQDPELLNRWLVGVARRVAARLRKRGVVRIERERRWAEMHPEESHDEEAPLVELRRLVREELSRLPEVSRQPLVLCYLEGLTHEEAAQRLGWPVGTVKVRLVRARRQLRDRLDRRGLALGVAFLLLFLRKEASASTSTSLHASTVEAMSLASSGELAVLEARFPRAFDLASRARWTGMQIPWTSSGLILLAFLIASSCGVAFAQKTRFDKKAASVASQRLAKVLAVDCR